MAMESEEQSFGMISRRRLLAGAAVAALLPMGGGLWAQTGGPSPQAGLDAFADDFGMLSRYLTGHDDLDPHLATRILAAFSEIDPDFSKKLSALRSFIEEHKPDAGDLAQALRGGQDNLGVFAQQIVRAWFMGVVGDGERARTVTYTGALMNKAVADVLTPPGYAMGPYGAWAAKPVPALPF